MGGGGSSSLIINGKSVIVAAGGSGSVLYNNSYGTLYGHDGSPAGNLHFTYIYKGTGQWQKINQNLEKIEDFTNLKNQSGNRDKMPGGGGGYLIGNGGYTTYPNVMWNFEVSFVDESRINNFVIFDGNSSEGNVGDGVISITPICYCPKGYNDCRKMNYISPTKSPDETPICSYSNKPKTLSYNEALAILRKFHIKRTELKH